MNIDKFFDIVAALPTNETSGCREWQMSMGGGYPQVWVGHKLFRGHRLVLSRKLGRDISPGMWCLHTCDNHRCLNEQHLYEGTRADNIRDALDRDRWARGERHWTRTNPEKIPRGDNHGLRKNPGAAASGDRNGSRTRPDRVARGDNNGSRKHPEKLLRGDQHPTKRLTVAQEHDIQREYATGGVSMKKLGVKYGVGSSVIFRAVCKAK
jgi:hypothetical protein